MDKTLHDLGGIVLNGLPTFFLVLILAVVVKFLYLKPLEKVLAERARLTEGAQRAAAESLQSADSKIAEYQEALNRARDEIYRDQAAFLAKIHAEQAELTATARHQAEQRVAAVRASLAQDMEEAQANLAGQSEMLAGQIAANILKGAAA